MSFQTIEDIYSMTPLQQGLLFHSLLAPQTGMYLDQFVLDLRGDLDFTALENAWQRVIARHDVLRTSFHWEGLTQPVQIVNREVKLPITVVDLSECSPAAQSELLESYLSEDRKLGFRLTQAPLMRQVLFQTAPNAYHFVWSFHHLILDGWSSDIVQQELFALYEAGCRGEEPALNRASSFSEYVGWLRAQELGAAETFWRRELKGFYRPTRLPPNRTTAAAQIQPQRSMIETEFSSELTAALRKFGSEHGLTLNTILLGAWALLLSRYAGERDVVIGVTVSGRPEKFEAVESIVGNFINTLPARIEVLPENLVEWLRNLQAKQLELRTYAFSPLVEIHKWSDVPPGSSLFDSIFVFENSALGQSETHRLSNSLRVDSVRHIFRTNYPLTVRVSPAKQLVIRIEYDAVRFDREAIDRVLAHFEALLGNVIGGAGQVLSALTSIASETGAQSIDRKNHAEPRYSTVATLHEKYALQARLTPDRPALTLGESRLTYQQLNTRANRLARYLQRQNVGLEIPVAICMERCLDSLVGMLGVLKAGGTCVPLDPDYPTPRLAFMIEDCGAELILTNTRSVQKLSEIAAAIPIVDVEAKRDLIAEEHGADLPEQTSAENLAYVVYTSGSTGKPKGVGIPHRAIVSLLVEQNYVDLNGTETFLHLSPPSFDASFFEVWGALLHGGDCVLSESSLSARELGRTLDRHGVNVLWLTSSFFNAVIDEDPEILSGVRQLLVGGEALSVSHVRRALDHLPHTQIVNGYGPTENTTFSCCHRLPDGQLASDLPSIPIGRPIAHSQVYVLDQYLNDLPAGLAGEICVGGEGLARGYLNEPALTAEKFVPDPYSGEPGARMYRTGDLGRYLAEEEIEFLGRADEQVKIRGYRIEPGEVETALAAHEQVRQAVVVKHTGRAGDQRLVAYVVMSGEGAVSGAELRSFLQARLPEYLIPSMFIRLETIPLTAHGKVDRRSLAARELAEVTPMAEAHSTPRTLVEELLAEIWCEVLGLERIGIRDDFLALGGHSLIAIQLISRIREAFGIDLELRSLFERSTIAALAEEIERRLGTGAQFSSPPMERLPQNGPAPLSFAQQRLWILDHLTPGHPVYNIPFAITIRGALNIAALSASLNEIVKRHEVLRARVIISDGQPQQAIAPALNIPLPLTDLSELSFAERHSNARRLATEEGSRPFDLSTGPLLRASLFKLAADEHVLALTLHHIVFDGWSLEILLNELAALYKDFSIGNRANLPELPIQYADYASWQRDWLQGDVLERQLEFWRARLKGAPAGLNLPSRQPRPAVQTFIGSRLPFTLPSHLYERLKTLTRNERATLFMTLLAGFKALLYRYTGETDLLVGTVVAGRNWIETEKLIGFFVNTLVLRTDFSADPGFRTILSRVREVLLEAYAHQDIPFEKVVEELQPERNLSQSPLFQVLFTFHHETGSNLEVAGLSMDLEQLDTHATKFDLYLSITRSDEGLSGILEYNMDLFDQVTMQRLLEHYRYLLEGIAANPALPISRQPLLLPEEQEMLKRWEDTAVDHPRTRCIHELFEKQAQLTPDAVALVWGDERITYRDLDQRANQVAHRLQSLGVGPEIVVAVFMGRTPELVIALLAILKAGGAYLPLDPAYPKDRIQFMMEDVNAHVLMTEEHLRYSLPENNATVVLPHGPGENFSEDKNAPPCAAGPQNLAYLIYTSGSTGRPKAVAIEHRSAVAFLHWARGKYSRHELSGVLATTSICFDISVFELFAPLSWGGKVILVENALSLLSLNTSEPITLVDIVPSAMAEVLKSTKLPASVCTVNLPGEPIPARLIEELYRQENIERIYNLYGPSEDTTYSTCALAERGAAGPPPAGRPISNSHVLLLDKEMLRVPIGVQGEIYIGGEGLARGYYGRADQTAGRFVPNLFSQTPGQRLYRTGDLGRYLPDGQIEVLGRIDHQVKIRGYRIELGEIEAALRAHEGVREAVVIARGQEHDKRILAYVVSGPQAVDINELQSRLAERLPGYMLPSAILLLESLPLLPNGKIDRNALPEPNIGRAAMNENYVAPRDELEQTIARVWQEVLGIPSVGVHDNFFSDLGGHSLLVVDAVTRLRECLDPQLSFVDMFHFLTVSSLADHLREGANHEVSTQSSELTRQRQEARRRRRRLKQVRITGTAD